MIVRIFLGLVFFSALVYALEVPITVSVKIANDTWGYTKAFSQLQDYYIECNGNDLVNVTPIGDPYFTETNYSGWCD